MSKHFLRLMLVAGIGMTGAACQEAPRGSYQPATGYSNPYYNSGYAPAPSQYGYSQPAPNYNQPRYATVTVTNRGQNGNRDDVVQQQVAAEASTTMATVPAPHLGADRMRAFL